MKDLVDAIVARVASASGAAFRAIATGGFHSMPAPDSAAYPLAAYFVAASMSEPVQGTSPAAMDTVTVQVSFWDRGSPLKCYTMAAAFRTLFDFQHAAVAISGGRRCYFCHVSSPGVGVYDEDAKAYGLHVDLVCGVG